MFKLISAALILCAGVVAGYEYVNLYKNMNKFTEGLISAFEYMASEIVFEQKFMSGALRAASLYGGSAGEFLENIAHSMNNETSAKEAFLSCRCDAGDKIRDILSDYFEQAGMYDSQTEHGRIKAVVERLKIASEEEKKYIEGAVSINKKIIMAVAVLLCVFIL